MDIAEALHWLMQQNDAAILFNSFDKFDDFSCLPEGTQGAIIVVELPERRVASFPTWGEDETIDPEEVLAEGITAVRSQIEAL